MSRLLVIILGPTASGKSALAVKLAKELHTEILSADSRQVYRELSIGTAVPTEEEKQGIPHHLMGHRSVHDYYNAFMFEQEALILLDSLFSRMNTVIMAGGSGLYIDAVCRGIDDIPTVDPEIRISMQKKYQAEGIESLRSMLKKLDPEYYAQVDLRNPKRLLKALEISVMTGKPYSSFLMRNVKPRNFGMMKIGITPARNELYHRINARVDKMMEKGLTEEARTLMPYRHLNALNTVGYKELFAYLDGEITRETAIDLIRRNTRRYARKQLTWFRKDPDIRWFTPGEEDRILTLIRQKTGIG
ncbi:MAG: tRNA (adenosine(37)-N6)-dimethylallyltransferase MiaA [Chlorobi bacterium]|nr:tRNA (adenosine(37)-N6)-dimethylallyltransferase MiaA [Chlorobiota bacterium]